MLFSSEIAGAISSSKPAPSDPSRLAEILPSDVNKAHKLDPKDDMYALGMSYFHLQYRCLAPISIRNTNKTLLNIKTNLSDLYSKLESIVGQSTSKKLRINLKQVARHMAKNEKIPEQLSNEIKAIGDVKKDPNFDKFTSDYIDLLAKAMETIETLRQELDTFCKNDKYDALVRGLLQPNAAERWSAQQAYDWLAGS